MFDVFLQKTIESGTLAKTVEIEIMQSIDESGDKKIPTFIQKPTVKGADKFWPLPTIPRAPDLQFITDQFVLNGKVVTDEEPRALINMGSGLNSTATTITIDNVNGLDNASTNRPSYIQIDDEVMEYTDSTATTITVSKRGFGGTTAATHSNNAKIFHPAFHYKKLIQYIIRDGGKCKFFYAEGSPIYSATYTPSTNETLVKTDGNIANMNVFDVIITKWSIKPPLPMDSVGFAMQYDVNLTLQVAVDLL